MKNKPWLGLWRFMINLPPSLWARQMQKARARFSRETRFLTEEHRRVHHFVVRELPNEARPLSPELIADSLKLKLETVRKLLDDLERGLTFLVRDEQGRVIWAYPSTVEPTPHRLTFSSGEKIFAA